MTTFQRQAILLALMLSVCVAATGQTISSSPPLLASQQSPGNILRSVPFAPVVVCGYPANGATPCTNVATTYATMLGGLCSPGQIVLPTTSTCSSTADAQGNFIFYASSGNYAYYFEVAAVWYGPFSLALGGSGVGSGTITGVTVGSGSGLTGGGTTGNVNLGLLGSCANAQTLQWNGSSWVCASVGAPSGTPGLIQLSNGATFGSDNQFTYDSISHTITFLNAVINGTMTWANAFGLNTVIPVTPACIPGAAGTSSFGINTDGNFAYSNNGDACGDILRAGGNVISGAPVASQTVTQPVTTSLNVNIENNVRSVVPSFNWAQTLAVDWSATGAKTATLTPCPAGIDVTNNANQPYKVYIPTTNPEVVTVTGGTCTSGGTTGTITFTTALVHSASSNQVGSSTAGYQEAINDGCGTATGSAVSNPNCVIKGLPTGATANAPIIRAAVFVHASNMTVDLNGVLPNCATRDRCFFMGDPVNSNHYGGIKILGGSFESSVNADGCLVTNTQRLTNIVTITVTGCSSILTGDTVNISFTDGTQYWGNHGPVTVSGSSVTYAQTGADIPSAVTPGTIAPLVAIIEDNALPGTIDGANIAAGVGGGLFNQGFVIDNDQAAHISHTNSGAGGLRCTAKHCASVVYSAGSTATTPVLWVDHANWSLQCAGNGLTNLAENTTHISDAVIQGFAQWGVNSSTILGSFGGVILDNVYNEEGLGPCTQPYNFAANASSFASVGVLYSSLNPLNIRGGEQPNGNTPRAFIATGAQQLNYYVVGHDSANGYAYPLLATYGFSGGAGTPVIQWPRIPASSPSATITYDVIRWGGMGTQTANTPTFPTGLASCPGGTPTACGSIVVNQAQCAGLVCTFTDNVASNTTSYSIHALAWTPFLPFWPGGIVLHSTNPSNAALVPVAELDTDTGSANESPWISVAGNLRATFFVRQCQSGGVGGGSGFGGGAWVQCLHGDNHGNTIPWVGATLYQNSGLSGGNATNVKGILNFPASPGSSYNAQHILTLADSNPAKTIVTANFRPPNDALDAFIGFDPTGPVNLNAVPVAFGSPISISNYIANAGDGTSYLERLTSSLKTFKVPITTNSNFTFTGSGVLVYPSQARVANLYTGGNPALIYCGTTLTCSVTQLFNGYHVTGFRTMAAASETLASLPFASTTWGCLSQDQTDPTQTALLVELTATTGTLTGTSGHKIWFACDGN